MHYLPLLLSMILTQTPEMGFLENEIPVTKVSRELLMPQDESTDSMDLTDGELFSDAGSELPGGRHRFSDITLKVAVVVDDEMPPLSDKNARIMLSTAQKTIREKLSFKELNFEITAKMSVEDFIKKNTAKDPACLPSLRNLRYDLDKAPDFKTLRPQILTFLKRWPLDELVAFFPKEEQAGYTSYETILDQLIKVYQQKITAISAIQLPNGKKLLAKDKREYRSFISWICAMRGQDEFDVILTNEFVLYDLLSEPYPHAIFQKCKVGGASLNSPKRMVIPQRALFASTFGMDNKLPFFDEDPQNLFSAKEKQQITGMFILAHELGHALFKLPDFYNHPDQCLMTTKAETDYITGYRILKSHPGSCPLCQPWVEARRQYFQARWLLEKGQAADAIPLFKEVLQKTPKQQDGSYRSFVADIGKNIATCHHRLGQELEAKRWLKSVNRIDPSGEMVKKMWQEWYQEKIPENP